MNDLISRSTIDALNSQYKGSLVKCGKDIAIAAGDNFFGLATIVKSVSEAPARYQENEFMRKLLRFIYELDSVSTGERQIALGIIEDKSDDYVGNVLLNIIDRIDHIEKIKIMANLFKAVARGAIDGEMFLRLSTVMCHVPYVDLKHLPEYEVDYYQPCITETLFSSGFIYESVIDAGNGDAVGLNKYHISHLGFHLARYGMNYNISNERLSASTKDKQSLQWEEIKDGDISNLFIDQK